MKVLHVISSSGMYGAESVILNLCRMLNRMGNCSEIAVFANGSAPNLELHDAALHEGIGCHVILCRGRIDRKPIFEIRKFVAQHRFDVVHAHGYKADIYT